ncbi:MULTISPECIES: hypothetical protein [unclassified Ruminococcus]|uniref:hypothetical protein n=1 Tax=unclassified Ruminococcus TaxID=2608920 RepID=UPI002109D6A1|nr:MULTISPECIES: hypothetical protein [unclassified Ruminococcus]MCQ4023385.1 hypothetical protein [Ruminococcus sp. zg-924]MCQ4115752.1 hypothetical protein [Ruminococcus sp. zg-921]
MKFYKKLTALLLSLVAVAAITTTTAFAEPGDTVNDPQTSVDTPSDNTPDDTPVDNPPAEQPEPDTQPVDSTPSTNTSNTSQNDNDNSNGYNDDYNQNSQNSPGYDASSTVTSVVDRDNEYYQPGTISEDSTQPVLDNKLYNASLSNDTNELNADDWDIALNLDETDGGSDFNFIKNNNSSDDSVWYQLMLFGGVLLVTVAIFGIILVIVMTVRTSKRNKVLIAKAEREKTVDISLIDSLETAKPEAGEPVETELVKSKFDPDNLDLSKYDKYL